MWGCRKIDDTQPEVLGARGFMSTSLHALSSATSMMHCHDSASGRRLTVHEISSVSQNDLITLSPIIASPLMTLHEWLQPKLTRNLGARALAGA